MSVTISGIMAKIQAHSNTKQINQIQDKAYVVQKQVQQQHFQKLKVRDGNKKGKVFLRTILCSSDIVFLFMLMS